MIKEEERTGTWHAYGGTRATPKFQIDYMSFCKLHKLVGQKSAPLINNSHFASYLAQYFPEVAVLIDEDDFGSLHLEVGVLKLASRDAIAKADWYTVRKHFNFVADLYEKAGAELRDALGISYLGNLLYGETSLKYAKARTLLPKSLVTVLDQIESHYEHLPS